VVTQQGKQILERNGVYQGERKMRKVENNLLTPNQFSMLVIFSAVAIGILSIPNSVVITAKQDGWISAFLGGIYPVYVVISAIYIARNHPNENILVLNKKFFGKVLGSILNIIQLFIFTFQAVSEVSGVSNFLTVYIISFLSNFRVMFLLSTLAALCAYKGLKAIGRVSEIVFYMMMLAAVIGILALVKGSFLNVMPIFGSGYMNILKGIKGTVYAYSGIEMVLLLYPYINDKNKLKASCLTSVALICLGYTWVTFATIYYLGHRIIPKAMWSSLFIIESLRLPIINNFRFIVMFLWTFVSITAASLNFYACELVVKDLFKNLKRNIFYFLLVPAIFYASTLLGEEVKRREIVHLAAGIILVFDALYIFLMVLIVYFKKEKAHE
jgi:spore germination protein (amino acid permease)